MPYVSVIRVRAPDGTIDGRTENISEGGLLIVGTGEVRVGDSILARLALPSSGKVTSEPATVRWSRGSGSEARAFGISFDEPSERTLEDIGAYVGLFDVATDPGESGSS